MKKLMLFLSAVILMLILLLPACSSQAVTDPGTPTETPAATALPTNTFTPTDTPCNMIGYSTNDADAYWQPDDFYGNSFTVSASIIISSLSMKTAGSCTNVAMAIYSDSSNKPGLLIASTGAIADTGGWLKAPITPVTLNAGNVYWLVSIGQSQGILARTFAANVGADMVFNVFTWGVFLTYGFPADASGLTWTVYPNSKNLMYASACN